MANRTEYSQEPQAPERPSGQTGEGVTDVTHVTQDSKSRPARRPRKKSSKPKNARQRLLRLVNDLTLFRTPEGDAFATVSVNGHSENWRVRDSAFRRWLSGQCFAQLGTLIPPGTIESVLELVEHNAITKGEIHSVHVRVAGAGGKVYLDLANDAWEAVEIDAEGWRVVSSPPVRFRRAGGMLPLVTPVGGGSLDELWPFLNLTDEDDFKLLLAVLAANLHPEGPYTVLILCGEQGSAKSTMARICRSLVDPNKAPIRVAPKNTQDLMIAAENSHWLAFDNLSSLRSWLSDDLCRLATGAGFATRALYKNREETIISERKPVLLNGIPQVAVRGDLIDRAVILHLSPMSTQNRRTEKALQAAFDQAFPRLLGALLDALSGMLRNLDNVALDELPRMADFARKGAALEMALGWEPGSFIRAYLGNLGRAEADALEGSPIYDTLGKVLKKGPWRGNARTLRAQMVFLLGEQCPLPDGFPRNEKELGDQLRALSPLLRKRGFSVRYIRHGREWGIVPPSDLFMRDDRDVRDGKGGGLDTGGPADAAQGDGQLGERS